MRSKLDSLTFKFVALFAFLVAVVVALCGCLTYWNMKEAHRGERGRAAQNVAAQLAGVAEREGREFAEYQWMMEELGWKLKVPYDFDGDWVPARAEFEAAFAERRPGEALWGSVRPSGLEEDLALKWLKWKHEYWLSMFEDAAEDNGLLYAYYVAPAEGKYAVTWLIDALREPSRRWGGGCIELCVKVDEYGKPPVVDGSHRRMFEALGGGAPDGYDYYDNEHGRTYAYYAPVEVGGKVLGAVGAEVEVSEVQDEIAALALRETAIIAGVLAACMAAALALIWRLWISKLVLLRAQVARYAEEKDESVVPIIEASAGSARDEVAALSMQVAAMIMEIENHVKYLVMMTKELAETKGEAGRLADLAQKDSLTGVRNKTAYDSYAKGLQWKVADGYKDFGIAMIDLNFLKRINDMYGHEKGNDAIKRACKTACDSFSHSPVFRIGGDEFVVILENGDFKNADMLITDFKDRLARGQRDPSLEPWERISAAIGYAKFTEGVDTDVANVFRRADKRMYRDKKAMKAVRTD